MNSDKWCKITGIVVYDPDGWDRKGDFQADWDKEVSFDEFYDKCSNSTTGARPRMDYDELKAYVFDKLLQNQTH